MSCRRGVAAGVLAALQVIGGTDTVAGQSAEDCDDRAALRISVVDESGFISIPGATVVLRWTDAVRRPVREAAGPNGRLLICAPRDAGEATLWAEFGDASSEESVVALEAGMPHDVELRLLLSQTGTGRLVGLVRDAATDEPVAAEVGSEAAPRRTSTISSFRSRSRASKCIEAPPSCRPSSPDRSRAAASS